MRFRTLSVALATATLAAGVAAGTAGAAVAPSAAAAKTPVAAKHGSYQFASNNGTTWRIGNRPVVTAQATQNLTATGVQVVTKPSTTAGYADSGVIVPLGKLSTLFNSAGTYVAPKIVASGSYGVNYYFDTNGDGGYLSFSSNGVYQGPGGDNLAAMSGDSADFSNFTQGNTSIGLSGQMTMENVLAAYKARTDGGTTNPEVWAWVGVSGAAAESATIKSVDGKTLVTVASKVTAVRACGGRSHYYFRLRNIAGGRKVTVTYAIYHRGWITQGRYALKSGQKHTVRTRTGSSFRYRYSNGIGNTITSYASVRTCQK